MEEAVDRTLAGGMPSGLEFDRQLGRTLARPTQRRHRVATGHRIDQGLQVTEEVGVVIDQGLPSTAELAYPMACDLPIGGSGRETEFVQAGLDGDPRESGGLKDLGDSAPADGSCFGCGPEAACPLIEYGFQAFVLRSDGLDCGVSHSDHAADLGRIWIGYSGETPYFHRRHSCLIPPIPSGTARVRVWVAAVGESFMRFISLSSGPF